MRWVVALVCLLGACDYVFTIKSPPGGTDPGTTPDGDPGKTAVCPPIGTAPAFEINPTQIVAARCKYSESPSANVAIVDCVSGTGILEGVPGGPFTTPIQIAVPSGSQLTDVRVTPEGDELLALSSAITGSDAGVLDVYTRVDKSWDASAALPIASLVSSDTIGQATMQSGRHVMIAHQDFNPGDFSEWRDLGDGTWDTPHTYMPGSFGLMGIGHPTLTPDGKRLVFTGRPDSSTFAIYYSDRANIDDAFTTAQMIPVVEQYPFYPFLAADCSRLYFAGLTSLSFVAP